MSSETSQDQSTLDAKFAGGLAWTAGAKWATQLVSWGSTLALARLLFPADVGVAEIAGLFFSVTNVLAEFGVGTAVLHMPDLDRRTLAQLHTFSILLCTGVFLFGVAVSPLLAIFFHSEHTFFFAANCLAFLITGMQAVPYGLLQRDLDYRRLSLAEAVSAIAQAVVSVLAALAGWKYWSLWAGGAAGKITVTALVCYWKPASFARPKWADIRRPVEMGRHVAVSRVTSSFSSVADSIVIGRILGESALGVYRMAMTLAAAPAEKVSGLIMRTAAPLFATVMDDAQAVRRYYLIITEILALVVVPLMTGLVMVAPHAVRVVLGEKWMGATAPLQWLGVYMIVRVLGVLAEQVLVSQRLTRLTMNVSLINFPVMIVAFIVAAWWMGSSGVAAAWIAFSPITIFPLLIILIRKIHLPVGQYLGSLWPAFAASGVMCLALYLLLGQMAALPLSAQVRLAALVVVGGLVYAAVLFTIFRARVQRYIRFATNLREGNREPAAADL